MKCKRGHELSGDNLYLWRDKTFCKTCRRNTRKVWMKANPEKRRVYENRCLYGLEPDKYEALFIKQGGVCAICKKEDQLHVDHDHSCCPVKQGCGNCVRGLLCASCNHMLGKAKDDPNILQSAINYLIGK